MLKPPLRQVARKVKLVSKELRGQIAWATKMIRSLDHMCREGRLRELGLLNLAKRKPNSSLQRIQE